MSHPVIQAKYDVLEEVAQLFEAAADGIEEELRAVERARDNLRGEWVGLGSEAFFREMDDDVVPAMWRLVHALREAARLICLASQIIGEAEIEAAALFQDDVPVQFKVPGKHSVLGPPNPYPYGTREWARRGLLHAAGIHPQYYDPDLGFDHNRSMIEQGYAYYQELYQQNPDLWWMGFAHSAVQNSIYPAFLMLDSTEDILQLNPVAQLVLNRPPILDFLVSSLLSTRAKLALYLLPHEGISGLLGPGVAPELEAVAEAIDNGTITSADMEKINLEFTRMQYEIFMDMGAAHYAYNVGGIELIHEMGATQEIPPELVRAFDLIERGDEVALTEAAKTMALYEQSEIIQRNYVEIANMGEPGRLMLDAMSVMAVPAVPGGSTLSDSVPGGRIDDRDQRMAWINSEIDLWASLTPEQKLNVVNQPLPDDIGEAAIKLRPVLGPLLAEYLRGLPTDWLRDGFP